ncbi:MULTISPECIES: TetR/AcrR family transcriptional regulator [unclassified Crossiella]|uniref:TetR/AcrR family transcriptional regulator n=1 Tax=unclassified Crossiella TaxID=2620835 RepID=UPI001FFF6D42|nr:MULTISPECIES: TetR/AcrR family transcriptional regulator [unclassified Crossiella]MCK2244313.1 TetR/AcrR family transcriptional regulator [Crossiella sp. S99.2]MCK2257859.1 TetR/AcrR family transcriptional regulator [Crossiella sp. S99.1]
MPAENDQPRSRRERPAKPALSRESIIGAALELVRAEGLPRVTMRRLAQELDTGAASLYVYVRNTAELHAAVLDELLGAVDRGPGGDWRTRLERLLTSYTKVLFTHPGLAQSALLARPSGPHYLNLIETMLALLDEGGIPPGTAAWGVDLLLQHATATAAEHSEAAQDPADWAALSSAIQRVPATTHPRIAAAGQDLLSGTPEQRLSWGFQLLINGLAHTPRPID